MSIKLTEEQTNQRTGFRAFASEQVAPYAAGFDRQEAISRELVEAIADRGYLGAHVPQAYGGKGFDMITYGLLHEEIGRACASVRSLLTVHDMVAEAILRLGRGEQRKAWLPSLTAGQKLAAFALTEPETGSDAGGIRTTATAEGDAYLISGRKKWISFGQPADVFLVIAKVDGTPGGFLIERDTPGLIITPMRGLLGLRATMLAELHLDDCLVPRESRVGSYEMGSSLITATALHHGRYSVAWGCVGIGEACLEASYRHSTRREQFGVPLIEHQLIRRMLTNMLTNVRAARLLCTQAGYSRQARDPSAIQDTLVAKYFSSRMASRVASDAVQIHGATGCSDAEPVERYFRDSRIMEIIEGSNEIQQITIAKHGCEQYTTAEAEVSWPTVS